MWTSEQGPRGAGRVGAVRDYARPSSSASVPHDTAVGGACPMQLSVLSVENSLMWNSMFHKPSKRKEWKNMNVYCSERFPVHPARGRRGSGVCACVCAAQEAER